MPDVLAPRYMTRFRCIGSACEATCCGGGWSITLDESSHRRLRRSLSQTREDRALFDKNVRRLNNGRSGIKYALIVLDEKSDCTFVEPDGLCGLQRRFGEAALPDTCATYPRRQSIVEGRFETAAVLSCPEAARLALLAKDAMELVDVPEMAIVRENFVQGIRGEVEGYEAALDVVRAAIMEILAGRPNAAALGTVAALADALGPVFGRGKTTDPAALVATLEDFTRPERIAHVARELRSIEIPLSIPMFTVLQVLAARNSLHDSPHFSELFANAARAYGIGEDAIVGDVARAYGERREAVAAQVEPRLGEILANYALNHTFAHWYTASPDLGIWVRGLLLRVALIRFLVFAHPDVAALASSATESDALRTVDRVAVESVHRLTRVIEHHQPFLKLLDEALPATMPGLEHALCLLKL